MSVNMVRVMCVLFLCGIAQSLICDDECTDSNPCQNGATCCDYPPFGLRCHCTVDWGGEFCDVPNPDVDYFSTGQDILTKRLNIKPNTNTAKNVIFFIGDGLDLSTTFATRVYKGQQMGKTGEETELEYETFPWNGLSRTYNHDNQVPDSAGTASAMLTGVKTNYGVIGVNHNVLRWDCEAVAGNETTSVLKWAQEENKSTGVVTTTRITHATPAAAYARSPDRYWESDYNFKKYEERVSEFGCKDIAYQLIHEEPGKNFNVIFGGGRKYLLPNDTDDAEYSATQGNRRDGRNLIEEWEEDKANRSLSYEYVWNKAQFDAVDAASTDYLLGLFEPSHMQYDFDRADDEAGEPSLSNMTRKAIDVLKKNSKGYFLLVEGGRIDHGHHAGQAKQAIGDTLAFEAAIKTAVDMTDDEDTLIVVTADHAHAFIAGGYPGRGNPILGRMNAVDKEPARDQKSYTTLLYTNGPGAVMGERANVTPIAQDVLEGKEFMIQAAVPTAEETHGGQDVAVYARGPMAHLFEGVNEQHYIAHVMSYAACIGPNKVHCDRKEETKDDCETNSARELRPLQLLVLSVLIFKALQCVL